MLQFFKIRLQSFKNAFRGVFVFLHPFGGWHAKIHALATIAVVIGGVVLEISATHWLFLVSAIGLVFIAEIFNTCIELIVDIIHPEWGIKAKNIKDMAAGAVLLASIYSIVVGVYIFIYPYFFA